MCLDGIFYFTLLLNNFSRIHLRIYILFGIWCYLKDFFICIELSLSTENLFFLFIYTFHFYPTCSFSKIHVVNTFPFFITVTLNCFHLFVIFFQSFDHFYSHVSYLTFLQCQFCVYQYKKRFLHCSIIICDYNFSYLTQLSL